MKNEKLEQIRNILKDEYGGKMSDEMINAFAEELYDSIFLEEYDLDDIFAIVCEYEEKAEIKDGDLLYIFTCMIDLLYNGEKTAQRLYKSFMYDADILETFIKLINENEEYLTAEEITEVKEKAFATFDRKMLEMYGIIE